MGFISGFDNMTLDNLLFNFLQINFNYSFIINKISLTFLFILLYIVSSIKYFSYYYMDLEKTNKLFFFLYYIFVFSMVLLILNNNWFLTIYSWDGLGISSYLLIVYYYSVSSVNSGLITMVINRLGDIFLMVFVASLFFFCSFIFNFKYLLFTFFLMLCAITKSAQFPFSSWLPLAMAAPTPISSLVHSSTLVTAGIFLIFRNENFFDSSMMNFIFFISLSTIIFSGLMSFMETDLKKLIALSTLSQLSFMFLTMSLGLFFLAFLHLLVHAIFKASLFFNVGNTMHNINSDQFSFSLKKSVNKFNSSLFFLVYFSLVGFPFSIGFYSKDQILDIFKAMNVWFFFFLFLLSINMTFIYSFRIFKIMMFLSSSKITFKNFYSHNINSTISFFMFWGLILLMFNLLNENSFKFSFMIVSFGWKFLFYLMFTISFFFAFFLEFKMVNYFLKMIFLTLFWGQMIVFWAFKILKVLLNNDYGWLDKHLSSKISVIFKKSQYNMLNSSSNWFVIFFFFFLNFFFLI